MINCIITSPTKTARYNGLKTVVLPAFSGQMQVLLGHAESFVLLQKGEVVLQQPARENKIIEIRGGGCYINNDRVTIIL